MPRYGRTQSELDIYHVTARGVGKQVIFEDDADRKRFGTLMRKHIVEHEVEVLAWCFMQNHVHLLLRCPINTLSVFMKRLLAEYAMYYNWRYERVGHLFQGRFDSKPVADERQFLATVRYIHHNPVDLGMTDFAAYPWSSYREYVGRPFITSVELALQCFNGQEGFVAAHKAIETDRSLEPGRPEHRRFATDDAAIVRAKKVTGCAELSQIAASDKKTRNELLALLREDGFTIAQIARITGISRNIIQRAK